MILHLDFQNYILIERIYFILNQNSRFIIISLILAGLAYWTRINGVWVFIVISLIYFLTYKKSWKFFTNYGIAIAAFLLIISPILIERNEAFDDFCNHLYDYIQFDTVIFDRLKDVMLSDNPTPWSGDELNNLTGEDKCNCPIRKSIINWTGKFELSK